MKRWLWQPCQRVPAACTLRMADWGVTGPIMSQMTVVAMIGPRGRLACCWIACAPDPRHAHRTPGLWQRGKVEFRALPLCGMRHCSAQPVTREPGQASRHDIGIADQAQRVQLVQQTGIKGRAGKTEDQGHAGLLDKLDLVKRPLVVGCDTGNHQRHGHAGQKKRDRHPDRQARCQNG